MPNGGMQASLSVAAGAGIAEAGSLGRQTAALQTGNGAPARGWPQFTPDSVFSTSAVADLYGTGSPNFISGGATSSGSRRHALLGRRTAPHLQRPRRARLPCQQTEEIDSSPAVGPILAGGGYGIATGTGSFWAATTGPTADDNTVKVYDTKCNQVWSQTLDGFTGGSPAPPTSRATAGWPWWKGPYGAPPRGASGRSMPPTGSRSGTWP